MLDCLGQHNAPSALHIVSSQSLQLHHVCDSERFQDPFCMHRPTDQPGSAGQLRSSSPHSGKGTHLKCSGMQNPVSRDSAAQFSGLVTRWPLLHSPALILTTRYQLTIHLSDHLVVDHIKRSLVYASDLTSSSLGQMSVSTAPCESILLKTNESCTTSSSLLFIFSERGTPATNLGICRLSKLCHLYMCEKPLALRDAGHLSSSNCRARVSAVSMLSSCAETSS